MSRRIWVEDGQGKGLGLGGPNFAKERAQPLYTVSNPQEVIFAGDGRLVAYTSGNGNTHTWEAITGELSRLDAEEKAAAIAEANANQERWLRRKSK